MKKRTALLLIIGLALALQCSAQRTGNGPGSSRDMRHGEAQELTDAQIAQVKEILSAYDPNDLTIEDAQSIHKSFREIGLRGGPELGDVLIEAGFDPETLRQLDPPPPRRGRGPEDREQVDGV